MKYWIIIDSVQKGPLSIEEIATENGLNPSTPVWHEGLSDWTTAAAVPEIAALLGTANINDTFTDRQQNFGGQNPYGGYQNQQQPFGQNPYGQQYGQQYGAYNNGGYNPNGFGPNGVPPMPDNYLIWAILATICCCIPTGIVAIIYAAKVSPAYYRGDYIAAMDASSKAQLLVIISFVAGLIWAPFSILFGSLL